MKKIITTILLVIAFISVPIIGIVCDRLFKPSMGEELIMIITAVLLMLVSVFLIVIVNMPDHE